jgi:hypothetical protein
MFSHGYLESEVPDRDSEQNHRDLQCRSLISRRFALILCRGHAWQEDSDRDDAACGTSSWAVVFRRDVRWLPVALLWHLESSSVAASRFKYADTSGDHTPNLPVT